jgi:hypothetical protein
MMHDIVIDELERHLSGNAPKAFYDHLDACEDCRQEVLQMDHLSTLLQELRFSPEDAAAENVSLAPLGFYNRVTSRIIEDQRKEAWGLFAPGAVFFRRIAFASLLLLAGLGSYLVSHEASMSGADALSIMAQHDPAVDHPAAADRDRMLVTLATYHE